MEEFCKTDSNIAPVSPCIRVIQQWKAKLQVWTTKLITVFIEVQAISQVSHIRIWVHGVGVRKQAASAAAELLQSCPTLCDPIDGSLPASSVPGILQAGTLEWVAISFSSAGKWKVKVKSLSRAILLASPWTAAYQAPLSMGFSRQEYWSELPLSSPVRKQACSGNLKLPKWWNGQPRVKATDSSATADRNIV